MQKKIIALAVAGLASTAAFAQSNVTVYGIVDAAYVDLSTTNQVGANIKSVRGINSGGLQTSRLGFRGTEDLGNGLHANFVLEYRLRNDIDTGAIGDQARQQTVGLSGNFGTVQAGRMLTLTAGHAGRYTAMYGTALDASAQVASAQGTRFDHANRVSNTVAYVSPSFNGVTGAIAYVAGANGNNGEAKTVAGNDRRTAWDASVNYAAGPVGVGIAYQLVGNQSDAGDTTGSKQFSIGGSYNFGVVRVMGNYTQLKFNAANTNKATGWSIGAVAPVGSGNVHVAWADSKQKVNNVTGNRGAKAWALAYTHGLSPRTTLYAGLSNADAKLLSTASFYGLVNAIEADKRARLFAAGVSHNF